MFAGLPGIGIGGLFYMVLAVGMLPSALWRRLRTASVRPGTWTQVALQLAMVGAMGIVLVWEADVILWGALRLQSISDGLQRDWFPGDPAPSGQFLRADQLRSFLPAMPYAAATILTAVVGAVQVARLVQRFRDKNGMSLPN